MPNCTIGNNCNIGQNVVISPEVVLGNNVKVQNNVSIYTGVICEDDVFLGPSMVFTNVINPRSAVNRRGQYAKTIVKKGVSIGANATIVCGNDLGEYCFIGAGTVVTKYVPPYALIVGNPGKQIGWISEYGHRLHFDKNGMAICEESGEKYLLENNQMVDLKGQYEGIKKEVLQNLNEVLDTGAFINGPLVKQFANDMESYLDAKIVIPCANGTDALQIAMMALGLKSGDEVIVPAFTYVATAEVIALLQLTPVMVDVDPDTFNLTADIVEKAITPKTKLIVPVHLYGQCAEMEGIMKLAEKHNIWVVEDNAQAIGADYSFSDGRKVKSGVIGHIGCTSFYPSKNLGAYGDGGAIFTNDEELGKKIQMIANHGQSARYYHDYIGCNSRLDSMQAAVLIPKLKRLDQYAKSRNQVADYYDNAFKGVKELQTPKRFENSTHVFHQYTLRVLNGKRDELKKYLDEKGIPNMIYYPVPLYDQKAFKSPVNDHLKLENTEILCQQVISLPIHTEMNEEQMEY
ncbi:unnamed protein product, partial [Cyprideis torosa]